jgi:PAS domain S-box-containing protein
MPRLTLPVVQRYGLALAASVVALVLTLLLTQLVHPRAPYALMLAAVMVSAWFGGLGPGLLATGVTAVTGYFFLPPVGTWGLERSSLVWFALFILAAFLIGVLAAALGKARRRSHAAQQHYRDLIDELDAIVWEADPSTMRFTFVSQRATEILGYSLDEWLRESDFWISIVHSGDRERIIEKCRRAQEDGSSQEFEHRVMDQSGELRWFRTSVRRVRDANDNVLRLRGLMVDITGRKRAEAALERLGHRNQLILDSAGDGIYGLDARGNTTFANPAAARMIGWDVNDLIGRHAHDVLHHSKLDGSRYPEEECPIYAAFLDGAVHHVTDEVFWRRDGTSFPVEYVSTPIREDGVLVGAVVVFQDITERKQAEKALRMNEDRLRRILETVADGILILDRNGRFTFANAAAETILGTSRQDIIGRSYADAPWEEATVEGGPCAEEDLPFVRVMRTAEPVSRMELVIRHPAGPRVISIDAVPLYDERGVIGGVLASFIDITDRKRAERSLRFLSEASELLVGTLDSESMLRNVAESAVPYLAELCLVDIVENGSSVRRLAVALSDSSKPALNGELMGHQYDRNSPRPGVLLRVLITGKLEIVEAMSDAELAEVAPDPGRLEIIRRLGIRAGLVLPLEARGRTFGTMSFWTTQSSRRYGSDVVTLAKELARRVALGVDNARLYGEAKEAVGRERRRVTQFRGLADASLAVNSAVSLDTMLQTITEQARRVIGVHQCVVSITGDEDPSRCMSWVSYSEKYESWATGGTISVDSGIYSLVCPLNGPTRMGEAELQALPAWTEFGLQSPNRPPARGLLAAPLVGHEGRYLGLIQLSDKYDGDFSGEDEAIILQIAQMASVAIENARLYREAESAQQRLAFLSEASTVLVASLDLSTTLTSVACLAVPFLADWCAVHVVEENGLVRQLALAHGESLDIGLLQAPEDPDGLVAGEPHPVIERVLQSSLPEFYPEIPAEPSEHDLGVHDISALSHVGLTSLMVVPLVAHGRTLGTMTFAWANQERRYTMADLALAEDLAHRAALAMDNARLYGQVQDAVRIRDEFLSSVSHDLKSPLTAIKGRAQLIRRRLARGEVSGTSAWTSEGLDQIDDTATNMTTLINELLEVAHLQIGQPLELDRRPTDLVRLVQQRVAEYGQVSEGHRIDLVTELATLFGDWDARRLDRVLSNLIGNATKFSPEGGRVTLRLTREETPDGPVAVLSVQDEGIGIPSADLPHIFERFHRAGNVVGRITGTGLGLYGVKRIVEQHGGTIQAESEEGLGSTFTVRLPLSQRRPGSEIKMDSEPASSVGTSTRWPRPTRPTWFA